MPKAQTTTIIPSPGRFHPPWRKEVPPWARINFNRQRSHFPASQTERNLILPCTVRSDDGSSPGNNNNVIVQASSYPTMATLSQVMRSWQQCTKTCCFRVFPPGERDVNELRALDSHYRSNTRLGQRQTRCHPAQKQRNYVFVIEIFIRVLSQNGSR